MRKCENKLFDISVNMVLLDNIQSTQDGHIMKVVIEKDEQGNFFVSKEVEPAQTEGATFSESASQEKGETQDRQPAKDIKEALMMAGKLLMMSDESSSMFDEGVALTKPNPMPPKGNTQPGMMG